MRKKRTFAAGLLAGILLIVLTGCMGTYSDQKESDDEAAKRGASADTAVAFAADFTLRDQYGVAHYLQLPHQTGAKSLIGRLR